MPQKTDQVNIFMRVSSRLDTLKVVKIVFANVAEVCFKLVPIASTHSYFLSRKINKTYSEIPSSRPFAGIVC